MTEQQAVDAGRQVTRMWRLFFGVHPVISTL